jgi:LuxR family maltose regulon positive regulatory protein
LLGKVKAIGEKTVGIREFHLTGVYAPEVLIEKIIPPALPAPYLSRGRLLCAVSDSLSGGAATIISGRAGTGKTALATEFALSAERPVAWYKVDAAEGDVSAFFRYLIESIARQRPGFGEQAALLGDRPCGIEDVPLMVESLVNELLQSEEPLMLILDDLHRVYDEAWVAPFFRRLLPLLPREVHAILIGRGLPPTPLWRLRSKQALRIIEEPALGLTLGEAEDLFSLYSLPAEAARAAWEKTRGRVGPFVETVRSEAGTGAVLSTRDCGHRRSKHLSLIKGFAPLTTVGQD